MYGDSLLLCKVLLMHCEEYAPTLDDTPREILDIYDSRAVLSLEGDHVLYVVKILQE